MKRKELSIKIFVLLIAATMAVSAAYCHQNAPNRTDRPSVEIAIPAHPSGFSKEKDSSLEETAPVKEVLSKETVSTAQPEMPAFSIQTKEADVYIQYGAYYYSIPSAPTDNTNRVGTLEKGTPIHMIGTVDSYEGQPTTWRGKTEPWTAFTVTGVTYFVPSEYVTGKAPVSKVQTVKLSETTQLASPYVPTGDPYTTIVNTQLSKEGQIQAHFHQLCLKLASGESVYIQPSEWEDLLNFYGYKFGIGPASGNALQYSYRKSDPNQWLVSSINPMNLPERYTAIIQKYGAVVYPGDEQRTMLETYHRLHNSITYDLDYVSKSFDSCIGTNHGVCWYYAQCFSVLLNYEGIPCYTIAGLCSGGEHEWCRAFLDGQWTELDPTMDCGSALNPNASYVEDYSWCR